MQQSDPREQPARRVLSAPLAAFAWGTGAQHLDPDLVALHASGELPPDQALAAVAHLGVCDDGRCVALLREEASGVDGIRRSIYETAEEPQRPPETPGLSARSFECRDGLWDTFEQLASAAGRTVDDLLNEAMELHLSSRSYAARVVAEAPDAQRSGPPPAPPQPGRAPPPPPPMASQRPPPPPPRSAQTPPPRPPGRAPTARRLLLPKGRPPRSAADRRPRRRGASRLRRPRRGPQGSVADRRRSSSGARRRPRPPARARMGPPRRLRRGRRPSAERPPRRGPRRPPRRRLGRAGTGRRRSSRRRPLARRPRPSARRRPRRRWPRPVVEGCRR